MSNVPTHPNDKQGQGALAAILMSLSFSIEAWLRAGFGVRYVGWKGPLGLMSLWLGAIFFPHDSMRPLACFAAFYTLLWIVHQSSAWYRRWRNRIDRHTRYSGRPHLLRLFPWLGEHAIKRIEPYLILAAGFAAFHHNRPFGMYLILSGLCLLVTVTASIRAERERALDLTDAVTLQQRTASNFRAIQN